MRVLVPALVCFFAIVATIELFAEEDAFIYYRYAWHWAHGRGLVFNPGEAVEGFSSPLWMAVLALVSWAGFDLPRSAPVLGTACGAAVLVASWWLTGVLGLDWFARRGVLAALALSLPLAAWSRSGLETPFYSLAIVVTIAGYVATEYSPGRRRPACRFLVALGMIVVCFGRPEGVLLLAVLLGDRLLDGRDYEGVLRYGLPVGAACLVLLAWRSHTFDRLVPNTAVKLYTPLVGRSSLQALAYVAYLGVLPLVLPLVALVTRPRGPDRRRLGVLLSAVALSFVFHFLAGGDYRPWFRYLVPTLPLALVAIWYGFQLAREGGGRTLASPAARAGVLLLVLVGPAVELIAHPPTIRDWSRRVFRAWRDPFTDTRHWGVQTAMWIDEHVPPGSVVAFGQMGMSPYFVARRGHDVRFIDTLGLVDGETSPLYRPDDKLRALWRELRAGRSLVQALEAGRRDRAERAAASILGRRPDFVLIETNLNDRRIAVMLASAEFARSYREAGVIAQSPVRVYVRRPEAALRREPEPTR